MTAQIPDGMERTKCSCHDCTAGCKAMPGCLIPGDIERSQAHVGDDSGEFVLSHFVVSDGALVRKEFATKVVEFRVPTIVPVQKPDGSCIFLDDEDKCSIHEVAPFGCAYHDTHMSAAEADPRSQFCVATQIDAHKNGTPYSQWCNMMASLGLVAPPMPERRAAMERLIHG